MTQKNVWYNRWPLSNEAWNLYGNILEKTILMIVSSRKYQSWIKRKNVYQKWRWNKLGKQIKENQMKKMFTSTVMGLGLLLASCQAGFCEPLGDLVKTTLLDRVSAVSQFQNGQTLAAAVDSIVLIGSYHGRSLLQIQGGFNKDTTSDENGSFIYGAQFRLDPFVTERLNLPTAWEFLRSLEFGPALHYNDDKNGWYGSFQVGLGFGLKPQP